MGVSSMSKKVFIRQVVARVVVLYLAFILIYLSPLPDVPTWGLFVPVVVGLLAIIYKCIITKGVVNE